MTTRPTVTRAQLTTLEAIKRGEVSTPDSAVHGYYDTGTWRLGGENGRAVTVPTEALISKGFARPADVALDGRISAVLTDAGSDLLADLASRSPDGTA